MREHRRTGLIVVVALLVVPAVALGAAPRPKAGHWKTSGKGGFTINAAQTAISGFHIDGSACGLSKLRVPGTQKLRSSTVAGVTNWMIGYADPSRKNPNQISGVVPQRVKVRSGAKTMSARLDIVFAVAGFARDNDGNLVVNGCDVIFNATH